MSIEDDALMYKMQQDAAQYKPEQSETVPQYSGDDWKSVGGQVVGGKQEPDFLKKLDLINTGVHRGVTHFTHALMSKLPFMPPEGSPLGDAYQKAIQDADAGIEAEQQKNINTYTGAYPQIGEFAGEMLATAPAGGLFSLTGNLAKTVGQLAPVGLKTLAKYGTSALGGAGAMAALESQRYNPNDPTAMFNTEAAQNALENPLSYAIPALGTKLSTWAQASRKLGEAKEIIPNIRAVDIKDAGPARKFQQQFFGFLPALTGFGKQVKELDQIGDDLDNFVRNVSGNLTDIRASSLKDYAAKQMSGALKVMKLKGDLLWDKPFKTKPITDVQGLKDDVINAMDLIKDTGIKGESLIAKQLQQRIRKGNLTVEDAKKINSLLGDAAIGAKQVIRGAGLELSDELGKIKDSILNKIQSSLTPDDMADFSAAREYSSRYFAMQKNSPRIRKAIESEAGARALIDDFLSEKGKVNKQKVLNVFKDLPGELSQKGPKAAAAAKIAEIIQHSDTAGRLNLDTFLTKTSGRTQIPEIVGSDVYKSLQGLNKYLHSVDEAAKTGWWRQASMLAMSGGAGWLGGGGVGAGLALASYGAAALAANHSPLKTALHALTKKLPKDTYDHLVKVIEKHFNRAGYIYSNGELKEDTDE